MTLGDFLPAEHLFVPLEADGFVEAITVMVRGLAEHGSIRDVAEVERAIAERRTLGTITSAGDVALPHYRTHAVERVTVALGVSRTPLRRDDAESAPRIVALILSPPDAAALHLQIVSALATLLREPGALESIRAANGAADIRRIPALARIAIQPRLLVRDIMSHDITGVDPDAPLPDAIRAMVRSRAHALPVLNDKREVLGIVGEADILKALLPRLARPSAGAAGAAARADEEATPPRAAAVRDVMSRSVLCVSEDSTVEEAANLMINKELEQFPVVREGRLTGWISRTELIRKLFGR